jgi:DnaA-homolog protein
VKQLVLELIPTPAASFDNFVVGQNLEVVNTLNAISGAAFEPYAPKVVYLWGVSGSGKTHCLQALALRVKQTVLQAEQLATADSPIVLFDDVATLTDPFQIELFNAINHRALIANSCVVVAGNVAPRDLALRPELTSRLGSGLVYQLAPLTDNDKIAALNAHAVARGFQLREEVAAYLLRHSRRDMASLMAMLDALDQYSLETGREITLPLLKQMSPPTLI